MLLVDMQTDSSPTAINTSQIFFPMFSIPAL